MKRRPALLLTLISVPVLCVAGSVWLHVQQRQYARNRQLIAVLLRDDTQQALALINEGADPNTRQTPLPSPSLHRLLAYLLHHDAPAGNSPTALLLACGAGWYVRRDPSSYIAHAGENLPLIQAMLAHGANVQARTLHNITALHAAADADRLDTAQLLLQHGADVNAQDEDGDTPLMLAIPHHTPHLAHLLLQRSANPNAQNKYGHTALRYAVVSPIANDCIPNLLAHGADAALKAKDGRTPLSLAQEFGRADVAHLLKRVTK